MLSVFPTSTRPWPILMPISCTPKGGLSNDDDAAAAVVVVVVCQRSA